jgi:heterokaryon incompatibility protein (HET)
VCEGNIIRLRTLREIGDPDTITYLALSHCWGIGPRFTLTFSSVAGLHEGIDISMLSKTFQDAISVTKRFLVDFGIRYLWIDSLCIIQDSEIDWMRESAVMGEIYQNAFCTITATAGKDGNDGLFRNQGIELTSEKSVSSFIILY